MFIKSDFTYWKCVADFRERGIPLRKHCYDGVYGVPSNAERKISQNVYLNAGINYPRMHVNFIHYYPSDEMIRHGANPIKFKMCRKFFEEYLKSQEGSHLDDFLHVVVATEFRRTSDSDFEDGIGCKVIFHYYEHYPEYFVKRIVDAHLRRNA